MKISMHCPHGFTLFSVRGRSSMNFYNGQWLIRDFGKQRPSIRFDICGLHFSITKVYYNFGY
jgi:hypothetical protein